MRTYGVNRGDRGCCPGHDLTPRETYNNRRSKKAHTRDARKAARRERRKQKQLLNKKED